MLYLILRSNVRLINKLERLGCAVSAHDLIIVERSFIEMHGGATGQPRTSYHRAAHLTHGKHMEVVDAARVHRVRRKYDLKANDSSQERVILKKRNKSWNSIGCIF